VPGRQVIAEGSTRARLVLIGEALGYHEERLGRPFVGPAGFRWQDWLKQAGLQRSDFYITNVYPHKPPDTGKKTNDLGAVPAGELHEWTARLHERLAALDDPWLIVPTGNTALRALTGMSSITRRRGSIYSYRDLRGRVIKVIPTIHPAHVLHRNPEWERRCIADWRRIKSDAEFRELRVPQREHLVRPTIAEVRDFLESAIGADALAIDIETPRKLVIEALPPTKKGKARFRRTKGDRRVTCVGFSVDPHFSLTIPTTLEYWHDQQTLDDVWATIRAVCNLPCEKVLQNGLFDAYWLAQRGITLRNYRYDTRWLSHAMDPLDAHDLGYQASLYTREPYWKDDTKEQNDDEADSTIRDIETFWRYNGKDAALTRELLDVQHARAARAGRLDFYEQQYAAMFPVLLDMMLHGTALHEPTRQRERADRLAETIGLQDKLTALAGEPLYGPKGSLSFKRLGTYLYEKLKLPVQRNRSTGGATTREVAVRSLMLRHPKVLGTTDEPDAPGALILRHRRVEALLRFTKDTIPDTDGRARSAYGWTDTLRLRAGKNPCGTGNNAQNTDRELLHLYRPDPGCIFLECDLSQAEDRVVKMLTRSRRLIERARAMPWENDEHRRAAALIYHVDAAAVTKEQRYIGKRARHAGNYGMRGKKLSEELLKEGVVMTPDECDAIIATVIDQDTPEVRDWQKSVRQQVLRHRRIENSWGLVWDAQYERLGDELFRSCYAFGPQSEVVMLMNNLGYVPLWHWLRATHSKARINQQKHDSLLISTPVDEAWPIACFLKAALEQPRVYAGEALTIPCEFKLGTTGALAVEFKQFPTRDEFMDRASLQA